MKARIYGSVGLSRGDEWDEKPHAVAISDGRGCNLWLGTLAVTADSADLFEELAAAALDAAKIQRQCELGYAAICDFLRDGAR